LSTEARRLNSKSDKKARAIIQRTLVAKGHSQTKPRRQILEVFVSNGKPLTPAAAHKQLTDRKVNLASVYRSIELFCRAGVLIEVDHVQEGRRYELSDVYRGHHHHLICSGCGKTEDVEECELGNLEKLIRKRFHFQVMRHDLRFIGLCQKCQH
jgi:Fur family ferric uptake transcriptional regulator